jgi:hypothetical protein
MAMNTDDKSLPATEPPAGDAPQMGFGAKLWNLFVDPRKTFASVGRNHEWIVLWALVSVIAIGTYLPIKPIVRQDQIKNIEERLSENPQVTPEQRQEIIEGVEKQFDNPVFLLFVPLSHLVMLFIVSGILLFIGNILLGGSIGFQKMLNAYAWTMMISIPAGIVTVPMVLAKGSLDVSLGLGVLTSADTGAFVKSLLSSIEIFAVWQVWLSAVAVSVLAPAETNKAFWSIAAAWLIWIIAKAGLATLGIQFGA